MSSTALLLAGVGRLPGRRARSSGDRALPCGGRGRTFESCRAHGSTKLFSKARNAEKCTVRTSYFAPLPAEEPTSRAQREREAAAYRDSLTPEQEVWALRKMGYFKLGQSSSAVASRHNLEIPALPPRPDC